MLKKDFLQQLAQKSNEESYYQEEILELAKIISESHLKNCIRFASEGQTKAPIYAFTINKTYKEIRIIHMIKNGLLEILKKQIDLEVFFEEFVVKNDGKVCVQLKNEGKIDFSGFLEKDNLTHIGIIYAQW